MKTDIDYARRLDAEDSFSDLRSDFHIPSGIYMCGNSLGLQPKKTKIILGQEMEKWATLAVRGHFEGDRPWMPFHKFLVNGLAKIVGSKSEEVAVMNSLTTNLHLMMVSFYRPDNKRYKILLEKNAFPSDYFAVESQIRFHGLDPNEAMVLLESEDGVISNQSVLEKIEEHGSELALIMLPGVQYYSGQVFDMKLITEHAHKVGAIAGYDLAHAAGNIPLELHDWNVDFAVWCHYKYLNSGPGAVGGCFIHEKHVARSDLPRFAGWWGQNESSRFKMENTFDPIPTAEGWQLSNPPITSLACILASLEIFEKAGGMYELRKKSEAQFKYMDYLLAKELADKVDVITPNESDSRGCQHSLRVKLYGASGKDIFNRIEADGVSCDWRYPDVIRVAPVPLYNSFTDIFNFVQILKNALAGLK